MRDVPGHWTAILRSRLMELDRHHPGVGEDVAARSTYAAGSGRKEKEKIGKGSIDGLMAAETGDNACVPGAVIRC